VATLYPEVLEWLASGEMTLSGLVALAPHKDDAELVAEARGKSSRDIKKLVAARNPELDWMRVQSRTRPVADGLAKLEMTVPEELLALVEEALDLDSHIDPARDRVALFERALTVYVDKRRKEKLAVTDRPRPAKSEVLAGVPAGARPANTEATARVPASARRETYRVSGGQCEYVSENGRRCTSRAFGQIDHIKPRALGGGHDQLRQLCGPHNRYVAEVALGKSRMDAARKREAAVRDIGSALKNAGFSPKVARESASAAVGALGTGVSLEDLLRDALQRTRSTARESIASYGSSGSAPMQSG
jgi:hypothetical protein